ncbi:D-galactarate permease [Pluralibacter gergoviae]|nr:D-galactarate permease [Pluralibacter gergoviae]
MKASSTRYTIFSLLFLIALINYVDRGALSFAANAISQEFHFSKVQLGAVLGYFGFGYLFGSLCGGFLADRLGTKKVWLMAGILWSLLEIATAWGRGNRPRAVRRLGDYGLCRPAGAVRLYRGAGLRPDE